MRLTVNVAAIALLTVMGYNKDAAQRSGAASVSAAASSNAVPSAPKTSSEPAAAASAALSARPSGPKYPRGNVRVLPASCTAPAVLLPGKGEQSFGDISDGRSDLGAIASQLLWANPQFMPVDAAPMQPGEVEVLAVSGWQYVDDTSEGFKNLLGGSVLAVRCKDAETCNDLAALYATVRKWPLPQLHCGELPQFAANTGRVNFVNLDGAERAPSPKNATALCARVAACRYRKNPQLAGKVFQSCMGAPVRAKAQCGRKLSCENVFACLKS